MEGKIGFSFHVKVFYFDFFVFFYKVSSIVFENG